MKHRYADTLKAIAEGKEIQVQLQKGAWQTWNYTGILHNIAEETYLPEDFRIKPETININGYEVPKPLGVMPEEGTDVFWPSFRACSHGTVDTVEVAYYEEGLEELLQNGLLHITAEAAKAHATALISFTKES